MKKNLLFVHSGGFWKDYTFKKAHDLGYGVVLAQKNYRGNSPFIDKILDLDVYDAEVAAAQISNHMKDIHGVTTFFELAVETTALLAEKNGLLGNSYSAAQNSRDKLRMRRCFEAKGIPSVGAFSPVLNSNDVNSFGKKHGYPIILKPAKFGASAGVVRINGEDEVDHFFDFVTMEVASFCNTYAFPVNQAAIMVETMIDPNTTEVNVDMIVHNGEPLVISVAEKPQDTTGPTFQENDYVMPPVSVNTDDLETIKNISISAVKSLGLRWGAAHLEAKVMRKVDSFSCYIVEVGARCGVDLEVPSVKESTGIDLAEIVIKQAMGDFTDEDFLCLKGQIQNSAIKPVAVQVIYAPKNGVIKNIYVPEMIRSDKRCLEIKFEYNPQDKINMHYSDYVGALMVTEETPQKALKLVNDFVSEVKIEM